LPVSPTTPSPTTTPAGLTHYSLSGTVTDVNGSPIPDIEIEVDFDPEARITGCRIRPCWVRAQTDKGGVYRAEFDSAPIPWADRGVAYVYAWTDEHEVNVQVVHGGSTSLVQDLRMRRIRHVTAGASVDVAVEADSSACTDLEDWWALINRRCEVVRVEATRPGLLRIEARAVGGGAAPFLFFATSGNYGGLQKTGDGFLTVPALGGTYTVYIALPVGVTAQDFEVVTSLQ
jgi:hypothetical protein